MEHAVLIGRRTLGWLIRQLPAPQRAHLARYWRPPSIATGDYEWPSWLEATAMSPSYWGLRYLRFPPMSWAPFATPSYGAPPWHLGDAGNREDDEDGRARALRIRNHMPPVLVQPVPMLPPYPPSAPSPVQAGSLWGPTFVSTAAALTGAPDMVLADRRALAAVLDGAIEAGRRSLGQEPGPSPEDAERFRKWKEDADKHEKEGRDLEKKAKDLDKEAEKDPASLEKKKTAEEAWEKYYLHQYDGIRRFWLGPDHGKDEALAFWAKFLEKARLRLKVIRRLIREPRGITMVAPPAPPAPPAAAQAQVPSPPPRRPLVPGIPLPGPRYGEPRLPAPPPPRAEKAPPPPSERRRFLPPILYSPETAAQPGQAVEELRPAEIYARPPRPGRPDFPPGFLEEYGGFPL